MHGWEGGESSFVSLLSLFLFGESTFVSLLSLFLFVSSLLWFVPVLMLPSVFAPRCWVLLPWWVPLCRLVVLMGGFLPKVVLFLIRVLMRRGGNARHGKISIVGSAL